VDALLLLIQAVLIFGVAFIYSNLGLGGGLLFVPILLSTSVPDKDLAVPISLTLTIATATSSVINHHRRGLVDFRLGGVLLAGALLGAVVGTVFTLKVLNQETFEAFFAAVLIVFGVYMVRDWAKNARSVDEDDDSAMTPPRVAATAAATTGSGFLSGSMGIGGGLLHVPLLVYVLEGDRDVVAAHHPDRRGGFRRVRGRSRAPARRLRVARGVRPHSNPDARRLRGCIRRIAVGPRDAEDSIRRANLHHRPVHRSREARVRSPLTMEERPYTSARVRGLA